MVACGTARSKEQGEGRSKAEYEKGHMADMQRKSGGLGGVQLRDVKENEAHACRTDGEAVARSGRGSPGS